MAGSSGVHANLKVTGAVDLQRRQVIFSQPDHQVAGGQQVGSLPHIGQHLGRLAVPIGAVVFPDELAAADSTSQ
ncbi:hypothetical protein ASE96_13315 [Arthrobacter sp. Leaf69]|nr:hypothetical protein ASE96_13315 [Arthrobacter sp. Leaf69]